MPQNNSCNIIAATYAATQNDIILGIYPSKEEAIARCKEEIKRDFLSIILRKKLRKLLLKNNSNIALHSYYVYCISDFQEVKE